MTLPEFESLVLSQRPAAAPWQPVTDYSFEGRKKAEGIHPQLILDVFQPTEMLDVGCGFNYLALMVNDLYREQTHDDEAVVAYGADLNTHGDLCFDVAGDGLYIDKQRDLVVCREVLEHLTIMQIKRAVSNLCALSSKFVYLTTRFHPNPSSLLDVATSDDLDPTHISMLNKDFLRVLFVLEGFKQRPDLEARMDWQGKNRCLVYERAS